MSYVRGKSKNEILEEMVSTAQVGSSVHEQQKAALTVRCTEDIEAALAALQKQLDENAKSSDRLSSKVYWLNVALTFATVVGAVAAVWTALLGK